MSPKISIIITNYNYSCYLDQCISSCIHQNTHDDYEIIIVDDGSTDESIKIIESYLNDEVHLIASKNQGIEAASNLGIRRAQGQFIVRVDADDYLLPHYLSSIVSCLEGTEYAFAYPNYWVVDAQSELRYREELPEFDVHEIMERGDFLATGTIYRKDIIDQLGGYDESIRNCGLENYHLILKLLHMGFRGIHIQADLFAYRRHDLNISVQKMDDILTYGRRLFTTLGLGSYKTNLYHPYKLRITDE